MPDKPASALAQFAPLSLARDIMANAERYGAGVVEWARGVVREEVTKGASNGRRETE